MISPILVTKLNIFKAFPKIAILNNLSGPMQRVSKSIFKFWTLISNDQHRYVLFVGTGAT